MMPTRRLSGGCAVALVAALTLTPLGPLAHRTIVAYVHPWLGPRWLDAALNVLLFVPLGAWAAVHRRPSVLAATPLLAFAIELAQLGLAGRNATLWDVITNTAGATVGYLSVQLVAWRRRGAIPPSSRPKN